MKNLESYPVLRFESLYHDFPTGFPDVVTGI